MVARIGEGLTFSASAQETVFSRPPGVALGAGREHDIAPDGERFLFTRAQGAATLDRVTAFVFVQNWYQELKTRVPTGQ